MRSIKRSRLWVLALVCVTACALDTHEHPEHRGQPSTTGEQAPRAGEQASTPDTPPPADAGDASIVEPVDAAPSPPPSPSCDTGLPVDLPAEPRVNRLADGRPAFDAWRDYACTDPEVSDWPRCTNNSGCGYGLCLSGTPAGAGVCLTFDVDLWCDGEGEVIGYQDRQCVMCGDPKAKAKACCAGLPGFDCRAYPFEQPSKHGDVCAVHADCESGLLCAGAEGRGYGVCLCPGQNLDDVELPDSCYELEF